MAKSLHLNWLIPGHHSENPKGNYTVDMEMRFMDL
jgi:hypothetical protein